MVLQDLPTGSREAKDGRVTIRTVKKKATNTKWNVVPSARTFCPVCRTVSLLCIIVLVGSGGWGGRSRFG